MGKEAERQRAWSLDDRTRRIVREVGTSRKEETAGDGATSRSVKTFQLCNVGNAEERETMWVKHK